MDRTRACITLMIAIFVLSSCGQPEFTYVRDRDGTTYFKVPAAFTQLNATPIDQSLTGDAPGSLAAATRAQRVWSTAFDRSPQPSIEHLLGSSAPFVYATVQQLTDEERSAISLDRLRDFILPVTAQLRGLYDTRAQQTGRPPAFTHYEQISDSVLLLDRGARGVHVRFNYQIGGGVQTFDHTAILDEKGGRVSVMLLGCAASCFAAHAAELDSIASSFKLLRLPG